MICQVTDCEQGIGDCDGDLINGCETDIQTSNDHCGGCNNTCEVIYGKVACEDSQCAVMCDVGWTGDACDEDVDEYKKIDCSINNTYIETDGETTSNQYTCVCTNKYTNGNINTLCIDIDECVDGSVDCSNNVAALLLQFVLLFAYLLMSIYGVLMLPLVYLLVQTHVY